MKTLFYQNLPDELACKQPIVLFDGECSLCSSSVRFILRHNYSGNLNFTSLQSPAGMKLLVQAGKTFQQSDTLLFLQDNNLYVYSTAALKITAHLGLPWRYLIILRIVPVLIRDSIYRYIARNRFTWFGRKSLCKSDMIGFEERFIQ